MENERDRTVQGMEVEIRWFVNKNSQGEVTAVYRTAWKGEGLIREQVWGAHSVAWTSSSVVGNWFFNGDNGVDEITLAEATSRLPAKALE